VPGGFGIRGVEGKIEAVRFARERRVPYLGICLGLQCAVIEIARNLARLDGANSSEFEPDTPFPVIDLLPDQRRVADKGGTMRLGLDPCRLQRGSKAAQAYGDGLVFERHRHRYEVNNRYRRKLEDAGLVCSGTSPDGRLVEIIELPDHPWFVAGQFHPEFRSRPTRPHPLFREFVGAATALADTRDPAARSTGAPEPSGRAEPADRAARVAVRDRAGRDRDEAAAAPAGARRPVDRAAGSQPAVHLEGSGEPRRGAPVNEGLDPSVYRRGDGEPEVAVEVRTVPADPVPAGEPGRP
jgi:hypothetical protein